MPKVLVVGATGFLGSTLCNALVRSSHTVYGLARSPAKARSLALQEIIPVLGTVQDSAGFLQLIRDARIDVVVDASGAMDGARKLLQELIQLGKERLERAKADGMPTQRLGFVYTSGMWVHGDSAAQVGDLDPVGVASAATEPAKLVAWRPAVEREALAAAAEDGGGVLDVVILRPAMMYGRDCAIWTMLLGPILGGAQAKSESVSIPAVPGAMVPAVHVEDAAAGFRAAVEKVHLLARTGVVPVFDLQTSLENMRAILDAAARALGYEGKIETVPVADNVFAQALSTTVVGDSARARQLLGWEPKRLDGFVAGMHVFAKAFAAGQEE